MDLSWSSMFVILLALIAANLPFVNERLFAMIPFKSDGQVMMKSLWLRCIELLMLYLIIGGIAYMLEARMGNAFSQRWEFYAITGCMFLVLAYPGYVWRYLKKKHN